MTARAEPQALVWHTARLALRTQTPQDEDAVRAYYLRNAEHFKPWDPRRTPDFFETKRFAQHFAHWQANHDSGQTLRVVLRDAGQTLPSTPILGLVNFSNLSGPPACSCTLGYSLDHSAVGQGLMREALATLLAAVSALRGIHRIQAAHVPHNAPSAATLAALGFAVEGRASAYLQIDGEWQDHVITAWINPAIQAPILGT
jgi:[ribosomal protein S5]-alanine N-acetyltransferase